MNPLPVPVASMLRRLRRRLAIGVFLDIWPRWALVSLLTAGVVEVSCRLFVPDAASALNWLGSHRSSLPTQSWRAMGIHNWLGKDLPKPTPRN
jgi:hypothetical protein